MRISVSSEGVTNTLARLVSSKGRVRLGFHRGSEMKDVLFTIREFDSAGGVATAVSEDKRVVIQFVAEDVERVEVFFE